MKTGFYSIVTILLCPPAYAQGDDFWLMLDAAPATTSSLQVNSGSDFDGGQYYGLAASIALTDVLANAQLYVRANQQHFDIESSDWSLGLGSNPQKDFSARVDYAWSGNSGELEARDVLLETTTYIHAWHIMLGYQTGEVEVFFRNLQHLLRRSAISDRTALHYGVGWSGSLFYSAVEHRQYDYEKNISAVSDSAFLQYILRPQALNQAATLAEKATNLRLGAEGKKYGMDINLSRITSALDLKDNDYLTVIATQHVSDPFSLALQVDKPLDAGDSTVGVNLVWRW